MLEYRFGNQFFPWLECMFFLIFTTKKNDNGNCEPWSKISTKPTLRVFRIHLTANLDPNFVPDVLGLW